LLCLTFLEKVGKNTCYTAFDRPKSAEKAPLTRRGGWSGQSEKTSMHLTIEKCSFGGRCKFTVHGSAAPKMNVLFIFPRRPFFYRVHHEVFSNSYQRL
jgi:hypothetical protein